MEVPMIGTVHEELARLHRELEGEVKQVVEKRSGLERELEALDQDLMSKRRMLELVKSTQEQLEALERMRRDVEGGGPGASTQVRGWIKLQDISEPVWPTWTRLVL
jgi:phage shock protein A